MEEVKQRWGENDDDDSGGGTGGTGAWVFWRAGVGKSIATQNLLLFIAYLATARKLGLRIQERHSTYGARGTGENSSRFLEATTKKNRTWPAWPMFLVASINPKFLASRRLASLNSWFCSWMRALISARLCRRPPPSTGVEN